MKSLVCSNEIVCPVTTEEILPEICFSGEGAKCSCCEGTPQLKGKNHHVFFDNFFTGYDLLAGLVEDGIYSCGTARKDRRGFPEQLKEVKLSKR
jgi:hypothetical protein